MIALLSASTLIMLGFGVYLCFKVNNNDDPLSEFKHNK